MRNVNNTFLLQILYFSDVPGWRTATGAGLVTLAVVLTGLNKLCGKRENVEGYLRKNIALLTGAREKGEGK